MPEKVYLMLTDSSSIFADMTQGKNVTGKRAVEFIRTKKVDDAIGKKVVKVVSKTEADKFNKEADVESEKVEVQPPKPKARNTGGGTKGADSDKGTDAKPKVSLDGDSNGSK